MNHLGYPPQPPLERGENLLKVPLLKGDLGGYLMPNFKPKSCAYTVACQGSNDESSRISPPAPLRKGGESSQSPRELKGAASSSFPLSKGDGRGIDKGDLGANAEH